jgi:hypothetical protein
MPEFIDVNIELINPAITLELEYVGGTESIQIELSQIGARGLSAYEVAVIAGFVGTEAQWLASLKGEKGDPGGMYWESDNW